MRPGAGVGLGLLLGLGACGNLQQAQNAQAEIEAVCAEALPLANLAIGIPTIGPFVAAGVQVGCGTAKGVAALVAEPSSVAWVNAQIAMLKRALGKA